MRKKDKKFWVSLYGNDVTYLYYYNRLKELAISVFDWHGLPDTVDERFLEITLFEKGFAVFFEDEVIGNLALSASLGGKFNVYNIPKRRFIYANNGYHAQRTSADSVIIYNNYLHQPSFTACQMYAARLANIERTIDINVNGQKTPLLLLAPDNLKQTVLNVYQQYDGNQPVVHGYKGFDKESITSIDTNVMYKADKLQELKTQLWNEALTYLGIPNVNMQKKERLITDEVQRSQGGSIASRYSRYRSRMQACDEINNMFGLNISVTYSEEIPYTGLTDNGEGDII